MVKSKLCALELNPSMDPAFARECLRDPGGYFIVKGIEKVILSQERMKSNRILVFAASAGKLPAK